MSWCRPCSVLRMFQSGPKPCAGHHLGGVRVSLWSRWALHPSYQVLHVRAPDPLPHAGLQVQVSPGTLHRIAVYIVPICKSTQVKYLCFITIKYTDMWQNAFASNQHRVKIPPKWAKCPCTIPLNIIIAVANKLKCEMFVTRYAVLSRDVTMHPEPVKNRLRC